MSNPQDSPATTQRPPGARLILASSSERRHQLLSRAGIAFEIAISDVDETPLPGESATSMVVRLARAKSLAIEDRANALILGCDTMVVLGERSLGKPADAEEAFDMLRDLSGRSHRVVTAFCFSADRQVLLEDIVSTRVFMRLIDPDEARAYIASGEPFGKAGAYAIQGEGGQFVDHIEGSYTNVMGLPVEEVIGHIERLAPVASTG